MRLQRLHIRRLPGIDQPFEFELSGVGIQVIFGPNAIGKSSICRAVEALYWTDRGPSRRTSLTADFELDGKVWRAYREGPNLRWECDGEEGGMPDLPTSRNHRCFFLRLRDLLDPSGDGTRDIATEILRQMSGGLDLNLVVEKLVHGVGDRHGRKERNQFNTAERAVREASVHQTALQRREDRLTDLKTELAEATRSAHRLPSVDRALGLADRKAEHAAVDAEIKAMPEALAVLSGNEAKANERHQEELDELEKRVRDREAELTAAGDARRESRLLSPISPADLKAWRWKADELGRLEGELRTAQTECGDRRKEYEAAWSAVGGGDSIPQDFELGDHSQLFEFLGAVERHLGKKSALEWRLALLDRVPVQEGGDREIEELRNACSALRSWLRVPEPETPSDRIRARRLWILGSLVVAAVGGILSVLVHPLFGFMLAAGAGALLPLLFLRGPQNHADARERAQAQFGGTGSEGPDAWDAASVEARLRELERETASLESRLLRARDRDVERQSLLSDLDGLAEEETAFNKRRAELGKCLGLDEIPSNAELVDLARALDQLRTARVRFEGAKGKVDTLQEQVDRFLSGLAEILEHHGEPTPEDGATARSYVDSLSDRNAQFETAIAKETRVKRELEQLSSDREAAQVAIREIYAEASLVVGDLAGLLALLDMLPRYRKRLENATRLKSQIDLDCEVLAKAGEDVLTRCDRNELEGLKRDLEGNAARAGELQKEIVEIEAEVRAARVAHSLQDLIDDRERARAELQDRRDEKLLAEAGEFLVQAVEKEYEQTQMPRVFERAQRHFSRFTQHGYQLRLGRDGKVPRLYAVDLQNGEGRELDALSDGTRVQLLLAARLAFAEEVEKGRTLPMFLDEALDHSDPVRFGEIVQSLGRIAEEQDRQIVLLTSDPVDIARLQLSLEKDKRELGDTIDLGLIRTGIATPNPGDIEPPPRTSIPAPDGLSVAEYGEILQIPRFVPSRGASGQHFFYLLPDSLDLLHRFLSTGIERVGQWKVVSGTPLADHLCSGPVTAREVSLRVELLETFCELRAIGRGKPIGRDELVRSGALSERYLDVVATIAEELGGDTGELLATLGARQDPRLKGLRTKSVEDLERFCRDEGHLDDRNALPGNELQLRALTSPAAGSLPENVAGDCLWRWWSWAEGMSHEA